MRSSRDMTHRFSTWIDPVVLLLASLLCGLILWWPLVTLEPAATPTDAAGQVTLEPPPSWLLPLDDAYIFIRFAQQLSRGRALEWNDGEPSSGATSFIYPFLLLPAQWLFDDLAGWSRWSSWLGVAGLWLLALAGHRVLRSVGLTAPWPLLGGLVLITWGPVGFVSIAGMDTALGCAAVLFAVALWNELTAEAATPSKSTVHKRALLVATIAGLPLLRPDFAALVVLAAGAILLRQGPRLERWTTIVIFVPGLALALCYRLLTGMLSPSGAIAKSALTSPFMSPAHALIVVWNLAKDNLLRAYSGLSPEILPPGVGLLAVVTASVVLMRAREPSATGIDATTAPIPWRALRPLTACWLTLVAIAPLSGFLSWQMMRHHHPGLVCAWLLALAGVALGGRVALDLMARRAANPSPLSRHWLLALFLVPLILLSRWIDLSFQFFVSTVDLHHAHGVVSHGLDAGNRDEVLLIHDAGFLALAHDGPMIDVIGLGTPSFARPYRHGLGAVVEALARRPVPPALAAVRIDLFPVPALLGPVLRESSNHLSEEPLRLYRFAARNLHHTRLTAPGIDLAHLPSERHAKLHFDPPPWPGESSFAITLRGQDGELETQGCRPVRGRLGMACPNASCSARLQVTAQPDMAGRLRFFGGNAHGPQGSGPQGSGPQGAGPQGSGPQGAGPQGSGPQGAGPQGATRMEIELPVSPVAWSWAEIELASSFLWIENVGSGAPCLESIAWRRSVH